MRSRRLGRVATTAVAAAIATAGCGSPEGGGADDADDMADRDAAAPDAAEPDADLRRRMAVVVGYGGRRLRSFDGVTWEDFVEIDSNGGDDDDLFRGIVFAQGRFVAVGGASRGLVMTSDDGVTWENEDRTASSWIGNAGAVGDVLVAAGGNGLRMRSLDRGATWEEPIGYQALHYRDLESDGDVAVAVGHTYDTDPNLGLIATTSDGITWTERLRGGDGLDNVVHGNGAFVACGHGGRVVRSTDGIGWTDVPIAGEGSAMAIFDGVDFVISRGGAHLRSKDGLTWSEAPTGWNVDAYFAGYYLHLGWPASIAASTDLVTWDTVFQPGGSGLTALAVGIAP